MRYSSLTVLVACSLAANLVQAQTGIQQGKITFEGEVATQTCQATVNGDTNSRILLPTVSKSNLENANSTAGLTVFTLNVTGCSIDNAQETPIMVKFNGHSVTEDGNLGNSASGSSAAKNVAVQLLNGSTPIALGTKAATKESGLVLDKGKDSATYDFAAQYISEKGNASAGSVQAVVEYALSYQ